MNILTGLLKQFGCSNYEELRRSKYFELNVIKMCPDCIYWKVTEHQILLYTKDGIKSYTNDMSVEIEDLPKVAEHYLLNMYLN